MLPFLSKHLHSIQVEQRADSLADWGAPASNQEFASNQLPRKILGATATLADMLKQGTGKCPKADYTPPSVRLGSRNNQQNQQLKKSFSQSPT